jgi:hypothetical protein
MKTIVKARALVVHDMSPTLPARYEPPSDPSAADLGASIAEHAVRLAHMYFEKSRLSSLAGNLGSAVQDKGRSETLYAWAAQAIEATNIAGHEVLQPRLEQLRTDIDSLRLSKGASNAR